MTPKSSFSPKEGKVIMGLLWATMALFIGIMIATWIASERAHPVLLNLETGQPVEQAVAK
jgi:hypothetical protein